MVGDPREVACVVQHQSDPADTTATKPTQKHSSPGGDQRSLRLEKLIGLVCDLIQEHGYWISHQKLCDLILRRTGEEFDASTMKRFRDKHDLPRITIQGIKGIITDEPIVRGQRLVNWKFKVNIVKLKAKVANGERLDVSKFRLLEKRKNFIWAVENNRLTFTQALKRFNVPTATGSGWLHDFRTYHRLEPLPRGGDKRSTDLTSFHDFIQAKAKTDDQITVADFVTWLQEEHQISCSLASMKSTLKELGIECRLSKVKPMKSVISESLVQPANQFEHPQLDLIENNDVALPEDVDLTTDQIAEYDSVIQEVDKMSPINHPIPQNIKRTIVHELRASIGALTDTCSVFTDSFKRTGVCNNFTAMLYMINLAFIAGCKDFKAVGSFVVAKFSMIAALLAEHAPSKPPKHATFTKFIRHLNPKEYSRFFIKITKWERLRFGNHQQDRWYGYDGKGNRGSNKGTNQLPIYTASIMGHTTRETVAVFPSAPLAKETKALMQAISANEIPLEYLKLTADALNCKTKLAELLRDRNGSYFWAVKSNNSHLKNWVEKKFATYQNKNIERFFELDEKHNKLRICCVMAIPPKWQKQPKWEDVQTIVGYATAVIVDDEKYADFEIESPNNPDQMLLISMESSPIRHFISNEQLTAKQACNLAREHWKIEENYHILDTTFQEDAQQIFNSTASYIASGERRRALNPLMRLNSKDTIPGDQNWANNDGWQLLATQTNICEKYPQFTEYFKFKYKKKN